MKKYKIRKGSIADTAITTVKVFCHIAAITLIAVSLTLAVFHIYLSIFHSGTI